MNRFFVLLIVSLLVLTGCRNTPDSSGSPVSENSNASSAVSELPKPPESSSGVSSEPVTGAQVNGALRLIPGGEKLLSSDEGLFLLKEYGAELKWTEANQIAALERGTPTEDKGMYFLLLPKYAGSQITVERLKWDGSDFTPEKTLYSKSSAPGDYGLVLTSDEPEASPNLRVTVTYEKRQSSYTFGYDGRGDRPDVLVFPGDEKWWEK